MRNIKILLSVLTGMFSVYLSSIFPNLVVLCIIVVLVCLAYIVREVVLAAIELAEQQKKERGDS